jgi:hypothetical protein
MADRDMPISPEHPEASLKHIVRGIARRGLKPVPPKASIPLRLDAISGTGKPLSFVRPTPGVTRGQS